MERKLELETELAATLMALDHFIAKNDIRGGYDREIEELKADADWISFEIRDIDAEIWENMLLVESDHEPLPKATKTQILLTDEVPF